MTPILTETQTGTFVGYNDKPQLKQQLEAYYKEFKAGTLSTTPQSIERYSRKALTEQLAGLINDK